MKLEYKTLSEAVGQVMEVAFPGAKPDPHWDGRTQEEWSDGNLVKGVRVDAIAKRWNYPPAPTRLLGLQFKATRPYTLHHRSISLIRRVLLRKDGTIDLAAVRAKFNEVKAQHAIWEKQAEECHWTSMAARAERETLRERIGLRQSDGLVQKGPSAEGWELTLGGLTEYGVEAIYAAVKEIRARE